MSKRVDEILSWYESDNPGVLKNLRWMMDTGALAGTGKFVILPVVQGFEHGPARSFAKNPAGYDPYYHFELAIESGCTAYAAPLGFLEAGARKFAGRIQLILKLNNSDSLYGPKDPKPAITGSVKDALRLGCAAIGFTIYPGSSQRDAMYMELRKISEEAKEAGLAVVVWSYPRGTALSKQGETAIDVAAYAAIERCLQALKRVTEDFGGRTIKTIGDEVMVVFPTVEAVCYAAIEMQWRVLDLPPLGDERIGIRIGLHYGAAVEKDGDVFGDSVSKFGDLVVATLDRGLDQHHRWL
jgi:DhnA family fructose-bisphosphate aldolase class Ia